MTYVEMEVREVFKALSAALAGAETVPHGAWRGRFDSDEYGVDAVAVVDAADKAARWLSITYTQPCCHKKL